MSDPRLRPLELVATAVLEGFQRKDLGVLTALAPESARGAMGLITEDTPRYALLFGADSWRMAAVTAWSGTFIAVRVEGESARVQFATLDDGDAAYVDLRQVAGSWSLFNVARTPAASFAAWGERLR